MGTVRATKWPPVEHWCECLRLLHSLLISDGLWSLIHGGMHRPLQAIKSLDPLSDPTMAQGILGSSYCTTMPNLMWWEHAGSSRRMNELIPLTVPIFDWHKSIRSPLGHHASAHLPGCTSDCPGDQWCPGPDLRGLPSQSFFSLHITQFYQISSTIIFSPIDICCVSYDFFVQCIWDGQSSTDEKNWFVQDKLIKRASLTWRRFLNYQSCDVSLVSE